MFALTITIQLERQPRPLPAGRARRPDLGRRRAAARAPEHASSRWHERELRRRREIEALLLESIEGSAQPNA